jgi:hypothetical protein
MPHYGTWFSYTGSARLTLAIGLLAAAAALTIAGIRLPLPAGVPRPGRNTTTLMVVAWALSIIAFLACVGIYGKQATRNTWQAGPPTTSFPSRSSRQG